MGPSILPITLYHMLPEKQNHSHHTHIQNYSCQLMGVAFPFLILECVTAQVGRHSAGNIKGRSERENKIEKNDEESREEEGRSPGRKRKKRRDTEGRFSIRCLEGLMIMLQLPPGLSHWKQLSALLHSHCTKHRDSSLMVDLNMIVVSNDLSATLPKLFHF